jgi:vacuolar-type H+-ATPase subunit I/STV1
MRNRPPIASEPHPVEDFPLPGYNARLGSILMPVLTILFGVFLLLLGVWIGSVYLYDLGWFFIIFGLVFLAIGMAWNRLKKASRRSAHACSEIGLKWFFILCFLGFVGNFLESALSGLFAVSALLEPAEMP